MSDIQRNRRKQILREAEGYLDLATACTERMALDATARDLVTVRALETLARLDDVDQDRAEVWFLKGMSYRIMERHADAIHALDKSAELDRTNVHTWLALGWCYKRAQRIDKAIEALEEAMQVDDRQAIIHYNLACYWSLAHNVKFAVRYLEQAFDLDPAYRDLVEYEHDFDPIRQHPRFQELLTVIV